MEEDEQEEIDAAVEVLEERGPGLGRPLVDNVHQSKHPNMKELRPLGGTIRILFAFDPPRTAILLVGGDKAGQWNLWYQEHVPVADRLYDDHLAELELEGKANE